MKRIIFAAAGLIFALVLAGSLLGIQKCLATEQGSENQPQEAAYLGMSLPADFKVFSSSSPWNARIGRNPKIHPDSSLMVKNLKKALISSGDKGLSINYAKWTSPIHVIDSKASQKISVIGKGGEIYGTTDPDRNGIAERIPMPEGIWADPSEDGHMILVDPKTREEWEFSAAKKDSSGNWAASVIDYWSLDSQGYRKPWSGENYWKSGARGSGTPYIAGLVRIEEVGAGKISHALAVATPANRKKSSESSRWNYELCSPVASRTDGQGVGKEYIPEGIRMQLDPGYNINSLPPGARVIAKALQEYGAFVVDNSDSFAIYLQNLGPRGNSSWEKYPELQEINKIPVEKFRFLNCNMQYKK